MKERVEKFGSDCNMVGVFTDAGHKNSELPVVLVLNAGIVHRVGPFRMNVEISRAVGEGGFHCFRFDMSGLGDSEARGDSIDLRARVTRDIADAMDHLEARIGAKKFVLFGLCSGAVNAHYAAVDDVRIVGCVLLDAYSYPTPKFYLRRFAPRLKEPKVVLRGVRRRIKHGLRRALDWGEGDDATGRRVAPEGEGVVYLQESPPREKIASELNQLLSRDVKFLFLFCGNWYVNYREQLEDSLPEVNFGKNVSVLHWPEADHTFVILADRKKMLATTTRWLSDTYGA